MTPLSGARADVLAAIRQAVARTPGDRAADYASIARDYQLEAPLDEAGRVALFTDRLQHYNVGVRQVRAGAVPAAIADACGPRGAGRMVIPPGFPRELLPEGLIVVPDRELSYDELDRCHGVLTLATLAIALTGTIVLTHTAAEGRRALTLIPDLHVCVVEAGQILATVPEAFRALAALNPPLVTTISGPSATADIEMIRVRGVHGPRTLEVILVSP